MAFLLCWKNIARGKPQQGPPRGARTSHAAVKPVRSAARCDWTKQGFVEREVEIEELFHALGSRHCKNEAAFSYCGGLNLANSTQWLCTIMFKLPNRFD
jgi:hypothetical protein